jgi:hypothetical protein
VACPGENAVRATSPVADRRGFAARRAAIGASRRRCGECDCPVLNRRLDRPAELLG